MTLKAINLSWQYVFQKVSVVLVSFVGEGFSLDYMRTE